MLIIPRWLQTPLCHRSLCGFHFTPQKAWLLSSGGEILSLSLPSLSPDICASRTELLAYPPSPVRAFSLQWFDAFSSLSRIPLSLSLSLPPSLKTACPNFSYHLKPSWNMTSPEDFRVTTPLCHYLRGAPSLLSWYSLCSPEFWAY